MQEVGSTAAVVLAVAFACAGAAKIARGPARTAAAFAALRLPGAGALARAVPLGELALGALLVIAPRAGGLAAIGALTAFSVVLARAIVAGLDVGCGCFGTTSSQAVSFVDLVRNGQLAVLGACALAAPVLVRPTLPAVVLVGAASATGAVVLALCDLYRQIGAVWRVDLAGEIQ